MTLLNLWENAQSSIKEKVGLASYTTWFSSINVREKDASCLVLETPDEFFKNWIIEHYLDIIEQELGCLSQQPIRCELAVNPSVTKSSAPTRPLREQPGISPKKADTSLNPRFSFDNFVVGSSNRFAYAACLAVAESPAKAYNPLFLYGNVGLGKTHLLQAITQHIKAHHPGLNYCYLSSESFTNELIEAIRHRSTSRFRQKYRNIDVLLIDDIHFIAGKESTQEEFFHTFNSLHNNRKQIIISSDRPPREIANLEERLSSRFAWGLITDIQPPDYETRVAILRKKSEREPVNVPDEVISFIAEQVRRNIRELEGALIRVVAYSLLDESPVSLDMAKLILKDMVKQTTKIISIEMVQKKVSEWYQVPLSDLKGKRRNKNILLPRQVAMFLSRQLTNLSLPEIGGAFGGKDHTTVLHSCKKINQDLIQNKELQHALDSLVVDLKQ